METKHMELVTAPGALYDFFKLKQVAVFADNETSIEDFAKVLYTLAFDIFYGENVKMVIEWNNYGAALIKYLQTIFPQRNEFDEEIMATPALGDNTLYVRTASRLYAFKAE